MASAAEPTADTSFEDLVRIYRENAALSTYDECRRAVSALRQLKLIRPMETEFSGERMTMESIEGALKEAVDSLNIFPQPGVAAGGRIPVIVPGCFY